MMLDWIMFDCVIFYPFAVRVRCVRAKASFLPRVLDDVVIHLLFKENLFYFIVLVGTNNVIVLCESCQ